MRPPATKRSPLPHGWPPPRVQRPPTPKANVRHARVGGASMPGAGTIAGAVTVVAEEGSPFLDSQRSPRLAGIETLRRSSGIDNHPLSGPSAVQIDLIPVAAPLPDVP